MGFNPIIQERFDKVDVRLWNREDSTVDAFTNLTKFLTEFAQRPEKLFRPEGEARFFVHTTKLLSFGLKMRDPTQWRIRRAQNGEAVAVAPNGAAVPNGNNGMNSNGMDGHAEKKEGFWSAAGSRIAAAPGAMLDFMAPTEAIDEQPPPLPLDDYDHIVNTFNKGMTFTKHFGKAMARACYQELLEEVAKHVTPLVREVRMYTNSEVTTAGDQLAIMNK